MRWVWSSARWDWVVFAKFNRVTRDIMGWGGTHGLRVPYRLPAKVLREEWHDEEKYVREVSFDGPLLCERSSLNSWFWRRQEGRRWLCHALEDKLACRASHSPFPHLHSGWWRKLFKIRGGKYACHDSQPLMLPVQHCITWNIRCQLFHLSKRLRMTEHAPEVMGTIIAYSHSLNSQTLRLPVSGKVLFLNHWYSWDLSKKVLPGP